MLHGSISFNIFVRRLGFLRKTLDLQPALRCNVRAEVKQMNIKQASEQSGVSAPNIRFYEKEGLLNPARLPGNDYRDYTEQDIRTLRFIRMPIIIQAVLYSIIKIINISCAFHSVVYVNSVIQHKSFQKSHFTVQA